MLLILPEFGLSVTHNSLAVKVDVIVTYITVSWGRFLALELGTYDPAVFARGLARKYGPSNTVSVAEHTGGIEHVPHVLW
jgi:hypothetical protein